MKMNRIAWNRIEFTDNEKEEITEMYLNKFMSVKEITNKYNCSASPINRILKENFIKKRRTSDYHKMRGFEPPHKIKLSFQQENYIKELWNKGLQVIDISKKMNIGSNIISKNLKRVGITSKQIHQRKVEKNIEFRTGKSTSKRIIVSKENKNLIAQMYISGKSKKTISNFFNYGESVITRILKEENIFIRSRFKTNLTDNIIKQIYFLYEEKKLSIKEIAKKLNLKYDVIRYYLANNSNKVRNIQYKQRIFKENLEEMKDLYYNHGWTFEKLGKKFGISNSTIGEGFKREGLKFRKERLTNEFNLNKHKKLIIDLYNYGFNADYIGKIFGNRGQTIIYNLKKWGQTIIRENAYGRLIETDDGHKVRSSREFEVANWLYKNKISYIYDKKIGDSRFRYDFFIPEINLYIEIWGLNNEKYLKAMKTKLQLYKDLNFNLLSIFPNDNIEKKLNPLLKLSKIQKQLIYSTAINHET